MSNPFVAEIRIFAGNFAPLGWATCDGQLLPLQQNTALFSLLGTTYGGDARTNFALPNMQGSAPLQPGQGPGLSLYDLGQVGGEQFVTLQQTEIPAHAHNVVAGGSSGVAASANRSDPTGAVWAATKGAIYASAADSAQMSPFALGVAGSDQPHNNMPPYLALTFIIAMQGVFPPRS